MSWQRFLGLLALLFGMALPVQSAQLAGSGDMLQYLKKIQGSWLRDCRKIVFQGETLFEQTRLKVTFTDLLFTTTHYSNADCFLEVEQYQTRYQYTLGEAAQSVDHKKVYELNLRLTDPSPGVINLPLTNIIRYSNGNLLFGQPVPGGSGERLSRLDYQNPFYRR